MCGILYQSRFDGQNVNKAIKTIYFNQKNRGTEGYGFVDIRTGQHFRAKYEHEILKMLKENKSQEILFHHRNPTSTANTIPTAHPIPSNDNYEHKYFLVHNGSIRNCDELYTEHGNKYNIQYTTKEIETRNGVRYYSFNDSESLLHELALVIEGKKKFEDFDAKGAIAFVLLQTDKQGNPLNLYWGRNYASPLKILTDKDKMQITSEGEGEDVETQKLFQLDYSKNTISHIDLPLYKGYYSTPTPRQSVIMLPQSRDNEIEEQINNLGIDGFEHSTEDYAVFQSPDKIAQMPIQALLDYRNELLACIDTTKDLLKQAKGNDAVMSLSEELKEYEDELQFVNWELSTKHNAE